MLDKFFTNESLKLTSLEPIKATFGMIELDCPQLTRQDVNNEIKDANHLIQFGLKNPIVLTIKTPGINAKIPAHGLENYFYQGSIFTSLMATERSEGIYYLKLIDETNTTWTFKVRDEAILNFNVQLEVNFTRGI